MRDSDATITDSADKTLSTQSRYARIGECQETKLGVCIFLSNIDLRELGIELNKHELIKYQINEIGNDRVLEISGADSERAEMQTVAITD